MKKFLLTIIFVLTGFLFANQVSATAYFVDFVNGSDESAGTATTTAWQSLDKFTENARSAGDIVFVRRGMASTTNVTDLEFTSDGTVLSPIMISADYDNLWSDFATSTETYTPTNGSKFIPSSASSTTAFAGRWIYFEGDCYETYNTSVFNTCEYAYEIASSSPAGLDLYLPYKGNQIVAGKYARVMPSNPQWNIASGDFQWNFNGDNFWLIKGMDIRGTDTNGGIYLNSSPGTKIIDCIFVGDGATSYSINFGATAKAIVNKIRTFNHSRAIYAAQGDAFINDCLLDGNGVSGDGVASFGSRISMENCEITNFGLNDINANGANSLGGYFNNIEVDDSLVYDSYTAQPFSNAYFEDFNGVAGGSRQILGITSSDSNFSVYSTTSAPFLRSGGGSTSMEINPGSNFNANWDFGWLKLFEYPIYADTSNKTYSMYFMSPSDTWTANPTNSEFWIECGYYSSASNAQRKVTKSTGALDFNGSTSWQALSVTCQPAQSGVLYLRGYYAKTKEAGTNYFYMDVAPVISTP